MRRTWRDGLMILLSASLAFAPAVSMGQSQSGSDQAVDGAKKDEGGAESGKSVGKTAPDSGKKTGQTAGDVGARLHDGAKGFGEALLGGIKYVGRTIVGFFEDDKK